MKKLAIQDSWLFAVDSPKDLARRLSCKRFVVTADELNALALDEGNFKVYFPKKGKGREVQEPCRRLQKLHRRIHELLSKIQTPAYLHSAISGHSYITNSRAHEPGHPSIKIDVRKFFPSVSRVSVFDFFLESMRCNREVAGLLANLLTFRGHLPTGSSASPIIAYYANKKMFDEIEAVGTSRSLVMTCYVDDLTLTGERASRGVLHQIRGIVAAHGLKSHKAKFLPANRPKVITGVVVARDGLRLPNRRHRAIRQGFVDWKAAGDDASEAKAFGKLLGRLHEAAQIEPYWKDRADTLRDTRRRQKN